MDFLESLLVGLSNKNQSYERYLMLKQLKSLEGQKQDISRRQAGDKPSSRGETLT